MQTPQPLFNKKLAVSTIWTQGFWGEEGVLKIYQNGLDTHELSLPHLSFNFPLNGAGKLFE